MEKSLEPLPRTPRGNKRNPLWYWMHDIRRRWAWARALQRYLEQRNPRNRIQLHRTLDALKEDGVIHGWGQDRLTSRYTVAVTEEDRRKHLTTGDAWTLIGRLRP